MITKNKIFAESIASDGMCRTATSRDCGRIKCGLTLALLTMGGFITSAGAQKAFVSASNADSAYLFAYSTDKAKFTNGLHFAWSMDQIIWHEIGPEFSYIKSDYGNWGNQKQMHRPSLRQLPDGTWEAVWDVNDKEVKVAYATTPDLVHWLPQDYYAKHISDYFSQPKTTLTLPTSGSVTGEVHRVAWPLVQGLMDECDRAGRQAALDGERIVNDDKTLAGLKPQQTTIVVSGEGRKKISDKLIGIFFEDINYAADGGLYAELIQNRDFEYQQRDCRNRFPEWNAMFAWFATGDGLSWKVDTVQPLHPNNPHYAQIEVRQEGGRLSNSGFDGIVLRKGEKYDFSLFGRLPEAGKGAMKVQLTGDGGRVVAEGKITLSKGDWKQKKLELTAMADCDTARLSLLPQSTGVYDVDMVSLFPRKTFKERKNGLRADLAQTLADMHPRFVRFPGGCVAHGDGLDNLYRWKNTIGSLQSRVPNWNIWKYHQTVGLGYYEYFLFCEDIGAEPLPVIAAGVPCQNSCVGGYGQQDGIPMEEMDAYIQDILDLVEWANGDPKSSKWAKMRADAGHPKPFNLKYIGIGNEDLISKVFEERFEMIFKAIKERYPDLVVVGTVGPSSEGSDYEEGWRFARQLGVPMVDEHYYRSPGWFLNHQDYYDRYARGGTQIYLGEYAAHIPGRANCMETALAEAMHLCQVERNGDVVAMTSYAPLLAKRGHTQWTPDMIYFTNTEVQPSTGYQVQALWGQNAGDQYWPTHLQLAKPDPKVMHRLAASTVTDSRTGDLIVKLVNMLPVENEVTVKLPSELSLSTTVEAQTLTGKLGDTRAVPQPLACQVQEAVGLKTIVPAYSVSVIRVKAAPKK